MVSREDEWFERVLITGAVLTRPGIYEWRIEGVGLYIGQSRRLPRRIAEYPNNVRKLIGGLPYRKGKPECYRYVHHQLRDAMEGGREVKVSVLENCASAILNHRERHWIAVRREEQKNGGLPVLNGN